MGSLKKGHCTAKSAKSTKIFPAYRWSWQPVGEQCLAPDFWEKPV